MSSISFQMYNNSDVYQRLSQKTTEGLQASQNEISVAGSKPLWLWNCHGNLVAREPVWFETIDFIFERSDQETMTRWRTSTYIPLLIILKFNSHLHYTNFQSLELSAFLTPSPQPISQPLVEFPPKKTSHLSLQLIVF